MNFNDTLLYKVRNSAIVQCIDFDNGPLYFLKNYFRYPSLTNTPYEFEQLPYQLDLVNSIHNNNLSINLVTRQMRMSSITTGYLLWSTLFQCDHHALLVTPSDSAAKDMMRMIHFAYDSLPKFMQLPTITKNKHTIAFTNGSIITAATASKYLGRGRTISTLFIHDFAFIAPSLTNALITNLYPALYSVGGKYIISSSPNTTDDLFWSLWTDAINGTSLFTPFKAVWSDYPGRNEQWANEQRLILGDIAFDREHNGIPINRNLK